MPDWNDDYGRPRGRRPASGYDRGRELAGDFRDFAPGTDRDEFAGERGGGFLGGDYATRDFGRRNYGTTGADYDFGRGGGGDWRGRGASGNFGGGGGFGPGGGYGTDRDYDAYRDRQFGVDRGTDYGSGGGAMERPSYRGRGPKGFHRSDERIHEEVCERLADHHDVDASEIEVAVSNGEVTLTGNVHDRRTKRLAEDLAETVRGVHDVHNHLKVDRGFLSRMADTLRGTDRPEGRST